MFTNQKSPLLSIIKDHESYKSIINEVEILSNCPVNIKSVNRFKTKYELLNAIYNECNSSSTNLWDQLYEYINRCDEKYIKE